MLWEIWLVSPFTGDRKELLFSYANRGHALAKLRGLMRRARTSELTYNLRKG